MNIGLAMESEQERELAAELGVLYTWKTGKTARRHHPEAPCVDMLMWTELEMPAALETSLTRGHGLEQAPVTPTLEAWC